MRPPGPSTVAVREVMLQVYERHSQGQEDNALRASSLRRYRRP
jgi:hypothetical protein